jgi:hypothetical protein
MLALEGGQELKAILRDFGRAAVPALRAGSPVRLTYRLSAPHLLPGDIA